MRSSKEWIKALKITVCFVLVWVILSTALMEFYLSTPNSYYMDAGVRREMAGTLDFLVVGASHAERGFNTEILDRELGVNSYNLANPNLSMQGRAYLLEKELKRNPVKTVILELSLDSMRKRTAGKLEYEGELYLVARLDNPVERITYLASALKPSEYVPVYQYFVERGVTFLKRTLNGKSRTTNAVEDVYKGHARYDEDSPAVDMRPADYGTIYHSRKTDTEIEPGREKYLRRQLEICREAGVEVILVNTPISDFDICRKDGLDELRQWYEAFAQEQGVPYYDFNLLKERAELFHDETDFVDEDHLWNDAQDRFSEVLCQVLKEVEAGADVSDRFYESYDAYLRTKDYYPGE